MSNVVQIKRGEAKAMSYGPATLLAADPADQQAKGGRRFEMTLYTGATFANSWRWGDVILDVAGFKPARQDLPAMLRHVSAQTVGWTDSITADTKAVTIKASGRLLTGDTEALAKVVQGRLEQGFPYQCSGAWLPLRTEAVQPGATATVNGKTVTGPCTIFREFSILEASFAETGWDPMTSAIAASAGDDQSLVTVNTMGGEKTMPEPTNLGLLAALKDILGADKAISLLTSKPDAKDLSAFAAELGNEVRTLSASLATATQTISERDATITKLEADLKAAKAAPAVITAGGDPSKPALEAAAGTPDGWKAEYAKDASLQAEFPSVEQYLFFKQREAAKKAKGA